MADQERKPAQSQLGNINSPTTFQSPATNDALLDLPPDQRLSVLECGGTSTRSCSVRNLYVLAGSWHAFVGATATGIDALHNLDLYTGFGSGTPAIRLHVIRSDTEALPPPFIRNDDNHKLPLVIHLFVHKSLPPPPEDLKGFFMLRAFTEPIAVFSVLWENLFRTMYAGIGAWYTMMHHNLYFPGRHRFVLVDPFRPTKFLPVLQSVTPFEVTWSEDLADGLYRAAVLGISRWAQVEEIVVETNQEYRFHLRQNAFQYFSHHVKKAVLGLGDTEAMTHNDWSAPPLGSAASSRSRRLPVVTFISRSGGTRNILNERELLLALRELPVEVNAYRFEELTLEKQIEILHKTDIFVAMHGAAMAQTLFLKEGSYVLELFPFNFRKVIYQNIAKISGLRYLSWQNQDMKNTRFRWDLLEADKLTSMPRARIVNLPIDWYNMDSKNYWRNQDTIIDVEEVIALVKLILRDAAGGTKFLMNAPWEQHNNQLVEFASACALGVILDRIVVLPMVGYRTPRPTSSTASTETGVMLPYQPLNFTWHPFTNYFRSHELLGLPCTTISHENFESLNAGASLGTLRFHPLGSGASEEQVVEYYGNVSHFRYDRVEVDRSAYMHHSLEEIRSLHGSDPSHVLALGSLFWYYGFGLKPEYPLTQFYNYLDSSREYQDIQEALAFHPRLESLAVQSVANLPENFVAVHLRRGDYAQKCDEVAYDPQLYSRCFQSNDVLRRTLSRLKVGVIFVATNPETPRATLKADLGGQYQLLFLEDLLVPSPDPYTLLPLDPIERAIVEQLICTRASRFIGNLYSSFSRTIIDHRFLRGKRQVEVF